MTQLVQQMPPMESHQRDRRATYKWLLKTEQLIADETPDRNPSPRARRELLAFAIDELAVIEAETMAMWAAEAQATLTRVLMQELMAAINLDLPEQQR